ncbi:MAG: helix-turn-helix domain-containing protein [Firmicutes bacterium]|nr:helix-turn-helix domain-containing protein [Bacillota bacterium]
MAFFEMRYHSDTLKVGVTVNVIIPEKAKTLIGMQTGVGDTYKTLYLLHGLSDDNTIWMRRTSIERYAAEKGIAVVMPNQTYHLLEVSADMSFRAVIMSRRFTDGLFGMYHQSHQLYRMIAENPIIDVSSDKVSFHTFFKILQQTVAVTHNPMRLESAKHLTLSMLYHYARRLEGVDAAKRKKDLVYERFCEEARKFFPMQHHLLFYAARLGVSGKYLTDVCKEKSGKTAADYIDALLLTECQALLLSTDLTVNQIARRLHFPSPSVFGKFFKRLCGVTPTQYREETR